MNEVFKPTEVYVAGSLFKGEEFEIPLYELSGSGLVWYLDQCEKLSRAALNTGIVEGLFIDSFYSPVEAVVTVAITDDVEFSIEMKSIVCLLWLTDNEIHVSAPQYEYLNTLSDHFLTYQKTALQIKDESGDHAILTAFLYTPEKSDDFEPQPIRTLSQI
ncbi:MAG: hypothetical protein WDZ94_03605 [Patescibacteria group bacterium]